MSFDYKETFRLDIKTLEEIDKLVKYGKAKSRSELIRAAIKRKINKYNSDEINSNKIEVEIPKFYIKALEILSSYEGKSIKQLIKKAVSSFVKKRPKELEEDKKQMKKLREMYNLK